MSLKGQSDELTPDPESVTLGRFMVEAERLYLERVLALTGNNKTQAAKMAGVSLSTLKSKLSRYTVKTTVTLR